MIDCIIYHLEGWSKKTPPLFFPIWVILGIVLIVGFVFPMWLIGFWSCRYCHRIYWMGNHRKHKAYEDWDWTGEEPHIKCQHCVEKDENDWQRFN